MDEAVYRQIVERVRQQGYDPGRLIRSPQS
jgi:hypothetical protein